MKFISTEYSNELAGLKRSISLISLELKNDRVVTQARQTGMQIEFASDYNFQLFIRCNDTGAKLEGAEVSIIEDYCNYRGLWNPAEALPSEIAENDCFRISVDGEYNGEAFKADDLAIVLADLSLERQRHRFETSDADGIANLMTAYNRNLLLTVKHQNMQTQHHPICPTSGERVMEIGMLAAEDIAYVISSEGAAVAQSLDPNDSQNTIFIKL